MGRHDDKREIRGRTLRNAVLSAAVTAVLGVGGLSVAAAQSSSAPVLDSQQPRLGPAETPAGPLPAPVGHRQPRQEDLPPSVLRDEGGGPPRNEGATTTGQGSSDRSLTICRKC